MTIPTATSTPPQVAINDIGTAEDFLAAIDATIKYFNDGDLVEGIVVKVDRDEVLLDIGYKTELSLRVNFLSSTTSTPVRLSASATVWKHSFSQKRTKRVV
jgi:ribosomal protein S1